jgi:hypothetical protein
MLIWRSLILKTWLSWIFGSSLVTQISLPEIDNFLAFQEKKTNFRCFSLFLFPLSSKIHPNTPAYTFSSFGTFSSIAFQYCARQLMWFDCCKCDIVSTQWIMRFNSEAGTYLCNQTIVSPSPPSTNWTLKSSNSLRISQHVSVSCIIRLPDIRHLRNENTKLKIQLLFEVIEENHTNLPLWKFIVLQ